MKILIFSRMNVLFSHENYISVFLYMFQSIIPRATQLVNSVSLGLFTAISSGPRVTFLGQREQRSRSDKYCYWLIQLAWVYSVLLLECYFGCSGRSRT